MKKQILSASLLAASLIAPQLMLADVNADFQWCRHIDAGTSNMSNVHAIAEAPEGDYYVAADFSKGATTVAWGADDITPVDPLSISYQKGFMAARMAADGSLKWSVVSSRANVYNNSIDIAATPDGGFVMLCLATFEKEGVGAPLLMSFKDALGVDVTVNYEGAPEGKSPYAGVLMKFSAQGAVEWTNVMRGSMGGDDNSIFDANPLNASNVVCDGDGNLYVSGYYKTSVDFGNGVETPKALNGTLNGTTLADTGDAFLVKYNAEGVAQKVLTNGGSAPYATKETMSAVAVDGGKLYCAALVSPLADADYSFMGQPVEISTENKNNIVCGVVDCATLECETVTALKATVSGDVTSHNAQIQSGMVVDDTFYLCGSVQGGYEQDGVSLGTSTGIYPVTGKVGLENMVVALSTADLKARDLYLSGKAIGNDLYVIESADANRLYALGYVMGESICSLREYDLATSELLGETVLSLGSTSLRTAYFNNDTKQLLVTAYAKQLTGFITEKADTDTEAFTAFHGFLYSYSLPDINATSAITAVLPDSDSDAPVEYFNLQGIRVANPAVGSIVIRRQGTSVEKLIVR